VDDGQRARLIGVIFDGIPNIFDGLPIPNRGRVTETHPEVTECFLGDRPDFVGEIG
jgi:hypothetical protein